MKKLIIALFVFALAMMITNNEVFGQTFAGTITVDSVDAQRGDQIAVGVRIDGNTKDIAGLLAPIRYETSVLKFDSVSFEDTEITPDFAGFIDTISHPGVIKISYLLTNYNLPIKFIQTPNGLLATLFFTVKDDANPGNSSIDSVNVTELIGGKPFETKCYMSSPDGTATYYPDFEGGNVAVLVPTGIDDGIRASLPVDFALSQNYPNPFNPTTVIGFSLPTSSNIKLEIFNVLGQKVATLASGRYSAGSHYLEFDASAHTSGIFFYRLTHQNGVETKKMLLLK